MLYIIYNTLYYLLFTIMYGRMKKIQTSIALAVLAELGEDSRERAFLVPRGAPMVPSGPSVVSRGLP